MSWRTSLSSGFHWWDGFIIQSPLWEWTVADADVFISVFRNMPPQSDRLLSPAAWIWRTGWPSSCTVRLLISSCLYCGFIIHSRYCKNKYSQVNACDLEIQLLKSSHFISLNSIRHQRISDVVLCLFSVTCSRWSPWYCQSRSCSFGLQTGGPAMHDWVSENCGQEDILQDCWCLPGKPLP